MGIGVLRCSMVFVAINIICISISGSLLASAWQNQKQLPRHQHQHQYQHQERQQHWLSPKNTRHLHLFPPSSLPSSASGSGTCDFRNVDSNNKNKNNHEDEDEEEVGECGRRSFFQSCSSAAAAAGALGSLVTVFSGPQVSGAIAEETVTATAAGNGDNLIDVYFGCGCFWHVQHEFVEAEKTILGRSDKQVTSRAGYAGGNLGMKDGKVCYHNFAQVSDYGKLGHAEVVSLRIPESKFKDFAIEYCRLFKKGMRPDQLGDRGLEYRNLVGFSGGAKNNPVLANQMVEASKEIGDELDFAVGKGSDADIPRVVWIMDSDNYPSYVAEQYHQFHDGFNFGENYPNSYNNLAGDFAKTGEDFGSCPRI
mmetsp:Transcript_24643/g.58301  ORF Transcript_24643/g.58301 Transcript_24643/m.58301 type:complete len:366 (+) Transcript_24643:94-1191(+)